MPLGCVLGGGHCTPGAGGSGSRLGLQVRGDGAGTEATVVAAAAGAGLAGGLLLGSGQDAVQDRSSPRAQSRHAGASLGRLPHASSSSQPGTLLTQPPRQSPCSTDGVV